MTFVETLRVGFFVAVVLVTYLYAGRTLIGVVGGSIKKSWKTTLLFVVAVLGILCMLYGRLVEPFWLDVTHVSIASAKFPMGKHLRIAHISDVHSDPAPRLEEKLPARVAAEHPDLIVFTGDSVNSPEGLPVFKELLKKLRAIAPVFVVKGNWDAWYWSYLGLFEGTGAVELDGGGRLLEIRGLKIGIAGVAVRNEAALDRSLGGIPVNALSIFLYHYPDLIKDVAKRNVDLYLAGHTHGGQIAIPGYGALVTFSTFGKQYESGLHREGKTSLYVNRGLGMDGGNAPRVRFWSRPELTIIDVVPPNKN
jgi:predicted MPP superfamily phosphohydrolase